MALLPELFRLSIYQFLISLLYLLKSLLCQDPELVSQMIYLVWMVFVGQFPVGFPLLPQKQLDEQRKEVVTQILIDICVL